MKKISLLISAMLMTFSASAQMVNSENDNPDTLCMSQFTAIYEYRINTFDKDGKAVTDSCQLVLQVGNGVWKTMIQGRLLHQEQRLDEIGEDRTECYRTEATMHVETTTVGHPQGKTTAVFAIPPTVYEVEEDTEVPVWTITEGLDSVCSFMCQKAKCEFRGKTWNVLFTEEVPTAAGPWKLHGLPGLIVSATDGEGIHTFRLIGLKQEVLPITHVDGHYILAQSPTTHRLTDTFVPYVKSTREQMLKHKKNIFGSSQYLTNPLFYMTGPLNKLELYGANDQRDTYESGVLVPDVRHKYQPLELK